MLNRLASLAMSTSVLKALPGKLDIKRHSPSILYVYFICSEYKVGYRKTMNRIRRDELDEDDKNLDTISELRRLIQKALRESRDAQIGAKHRVQRQASMRRASLTAVFKLGMKDK